MKQLLFITNEKKEIIFTEQGTFEGLKKKVDAFIEKNTSGGIKANIICLTTVRMMGHYSLGRPFVEVEEAPKKKRGRPSKED